MPRDWCALAVALAGKRVVVTAGPTREPIDPIRVVSNRSSGKMGYRVAEAAWERGADVVLISGPTALPPPIGVTLRQIDSTRELEAAVRAELPAADVLVMAAAPADYRPSSPSDSKRSRVEGALAIPMEPTEDILGSTRDHRKKGSVMVGFALETGDALAKGLAKLERKALDLIVVNDALGAGRRVREGYQSGCAARPGRQPPYSPAAIETRSGGGDSRRGGGIPWPMSGGGTWNSRSSSVARRWFVERGGGAAGQVAASPAEFQRRSEPPLHEPR